MKFGLQRHLAALVAASLLLDPSWAGALPRSSFELASTAPFSQQALANVALGAHKLLSVLPQRRTWRRLGDQWDGRRWVARKTLSFYVGQAFRAPAWFAMGIGLSGPPINPLPDFPLEDQNDRFAFHKKYDPADGWSYLLVDKTKGTSASVSQKGNDLYSFVAKVNGKPREMIKYHGYGKIGRGGNPILFPYANRVGYMKIVTDKGTLELTGERWVLRLENEEHAIHGVVSNALWHSDHHSLTTNGISLAQTISLDDLFDSDDLKEFFGHATLSVTHTLDGNNLESTAVVHNPSSHWISFSMAFHTYFNIPKIDGSRKHVWAKIPGKNVWINDSESKLPKKQAPVPVDTVEPELNLLDGRPLGMFNYDHVFTNLVRDAQGWAKAILRYVTTEDHFQIVIKFGRKFRHVVLYTDDDSVAVEPQTSATDPFALDQDPETEDAATLAKLDRESDWKETSRIEVTDYDGAPSTDVAVAPRRRTIVLTPQKLAELALQAAENYLWLPLYRAIIAKRAIELVQQPPLVVGSQWKVLRSIARTLDFLNAAAQIDRESIVDSMAARRNKVSVLIADALLVGSADSSQLAFWKALKIEASGIQLVSKELQKVFSPARTKRFIDGLRSGQVELAVPKELGDVIEPYTKDTILIARAQQSDRSSDRWILQLSMKDSMLTLRMTDAQNRIVSSQTFDVKTRGLGRVLANAVNASISPLRTLGTQKRLIEDILRATPKDGSSRHTHRSSMIPMAETLWLSWMLTHRQLLSPLLLALSVASLVMTIGRAIVDYRLRLLNPRPFLISA